MSTGISMSSVNKIKELADNGDYSLALDILEHQDLSKSLSPQFIRICGEVYYENGRYADARAALVRAHSMAPAGNKIIYSIIKLYLSMGFRKQAEHYFEIYRFNQESKDAGTYRIEYMIAKAYHKPVNELYSILVSANDVETSEEWDYEMLLLHAYIRNKDKFDSAAIEFKAKYRNSSRLSTLDSLIENTESLESKVYIFPCEDRNDDDPEQEEIREFEKKILDEDDLKIHPKDAKIMIMVEDDAPVTSSMKFKQMWVRSKDKKEHKKELRREETEEENKKDKKRSHGLWGIMSKKEEELVDKEMQDILSENMDKEKLLGEVVTSKAGELESAHVDEKTVSETSAVSETESSEMKSGSLNEDRTYVKCYMGDTGLLISHTFDENEISDGELYREILLGKLSVNEGMFYENVIAQMLVAAGHKLYFYTRYNQEKHRNDMEIDFILSNHSKLRYKIFPIEVKSNDKYSIRSLTRFNESFRQRIGGSYVIHPKNLSVKEGVVYLPAYMTFCL